MSTPVVDVVRCSVCGHGFVATLCGNCSQREEGRRAVEEVSALLEHERGEAAKVRVLLEEEGKVPTELTGEGGEGPAKVVVEMVWPV